jgi:hypothetical protein
MNEACREELDKRFPPTFADTPYGDNAGYQGDLIALVSLCLVAASQYKSEDTHDGISLPGIPMTIDEAIEYLGEGGQYAPPDDFAEMLTAAREYIAGRLAASKENLPRLEKLRRKFGISDFEFFAFLCAAACILDSACEQLFAALGANKENVPTVGSVLAVWTAAFGVTDDWRKAAQPSNILWRTFFAAPEDTIPPLRLPLVLRPAARGFILSAGMDETIEVFENGDDLARIADKINAVFDQTDLVLDNNTRDLLNIICSRMKLRQKVEFEWGFSGKRPYGRGVSVLLYDPPGTGKTMSAQVMARELDLPLYRINLAQIISKYIGETTKNFDAVFNAARHGNVILFFDEADALFAKRTEVKNSNDRHANSESAYLLQKIEEYPGMSILATNLATNLDEAFRRRINYMVNLEMPSEEIRLVLWKKTFPAETPVSPDIDYELLAKALEISGSIIKSAAVQSAYFAAMDGTCVTMEHIVRSLRMELTKLGKPEPRLFTVFG